MRFEVVVKKKLWRIIVVAVLAASLVVGGVFVGKAIKDHQKQKEWQQMVAEYRAAKMAQYEKENAEYDDYEVEIAFLGDSLTDGYDLKAYYPQYLTVNRGISGDTTFDLENRLQVSVYDLKPQVAVLLIGGNNFDTMLDNYERILQGLKTNLPQTRVVVLSLTAMGGEHWGKNNQKAAENNITIRLLADRYGYAFVDLFTPLYDVSIGEVYAGYTTDGGHLTATGYEVVTAQITPALQNILGH